MSSWLDSAIRRISLLISPVAAWIGDHPFLSVFLTVSAIGLSALHYVRLLLSPVLSSNSTRILTHSDLKMLLFPIVYENQGLRLEA